MYRFPKTYTQKQIKQFFKTKNDFLHKELNKNKNNDKMYSIILDKIFENLNESKKY